MSTRKIMKRSIIKPVENEQNRPNTTTETFEHVDTSPNDGDKLRLIIPAQMAEHFVFVWLNLNGNDSVKNIENWNSKLQTISSVHWF